MENLAKISFFRRYRFIALSLLGILLIYFLSNFIYSQIFKIVPETAYYFMPSIGFSGKEKRVLVFSPHPDDETLASAGYIQAALARGIEVKIVLITDGNRRGKGEKRKIEFQKAMSHLGLENNNLAFLDYKDGYLKYSNQYDMVEVFSKIIIEFDPQVIIYPSRFDEHLDHRVVGLAIEKISKDHRQIHKFAYLTHFSGYPYPRKLAQDRFLMEPASLFFRCQWFKFPLTDDQQSKKLEALKNYQVSLSYPRESGYLFSFVRKNELFCQE